MKIAGIILLIVGVAALIYGGFSYTTHKKEVEMGPIQVEKKEHHSVPTPPIMGIVGIGAGGVLIYWGAKKSR